MDQTLNRMPKMKKFYFCACSFGKDSLATVLLALHHNEPLDEVVFTEVMYDNQRGISGEDPRHIEWVYNHAKPMLEAMGVKVRILQTKDYMSVFHHVITKSKHPDRNGKIRAFPIANRCVVLRDCKLRTMNQYIHEVKKEHKEWCQYVGIAADETERLNRKNMDGHKISLLSKYQYTEKMAYDLCKRYNLLSPQYEVAHRNGCWFCPNRNTQTMAEFKQQYPELWNELLELGKTPNKVSPCFKYNKTIEEIDKEVNFAMRQLKLWQ
jgi:3'-phosphoadenosine 5'-phosphosulfate sulfotransferase (PAPS reductase)/FAD synthetase